MMPRLIIFLIFFVPLWLSAQVTLSVQLPPGGIIQREQLWNLVVTNSSAGSLEAGILLNLRAEATGQVVISAASGSFMLGKGIKMLSAKELMPIQYYTEDYGQGRGFLPLGSYLACYTIVRSVGETPVALAEECVRINITPLSPPLLNTPANQATIYSDRPQFTWLPPAPVELFHSLEFDVKLVEVNQGQSLGEAIGQNPPVFRVSHYKNQFMNFPIAAAPLDTGKQYAWQVIAFNNQQYTDQSEIWSFRLGSQRTGQPAGGPGAYVKLTKELQASVASCSGVLHLAYNNESNDPAVTYEVVALSTKPVRVKRGALQLKPGQNLVDITFLPKDLEPGIQYLFQLRNSRRETWQVKFIFSK